MFCGCGPAAALRQLTTPEVNAQATSHLGVDFGVLLKVCYISRSAVTIWLLYAHHLVAK